ncbi:hypothetical protein ACFY4C_40090 [Actinomadura viridis]|uniref:hypothetical protein n=1 Tax=Actinomadura viridis TaxID=58110 RepID=UPI0036CB8203
MITNSATVPPKARHNEAGHAFLASESSSTDIGPASKSAIKQHRLHMSCLTHSAYLVGAVIGLLSILGLVFIKLIDQLRSVPEFAELPPPPSLGKFMAAMGVCGLVILFIEYLSQSLLSLERPQPALGSNPAEPTRRSGSYEAADDLLTELDAPAKELFQRAQSAAEAVLSSSLFRAGVMDTIATQLAVEAAQAQIVQMLRIHSEMRADHIQARMRVRTESAVQLLCRHQDALAASVQAATALVQGLEEHADQVRRADEVYEAVVTSDKLAVRERDLPALLSHEHLADVSLGELRGLSVKLNLLVGALQSMSDWSAHTAALPTSQSASTMPQPGQGLPH